MAVPRHYDVRVCGESRLENDIVVWITRDNADRLSGRDEHKRLADEVYDGLDMSCRKTELGSQQDALKLGQQSVRGEPTDPMTTEFGWIRE